MMTKQVRIFTLLVLLGSCLAACTPADEQDAALTDNSQSADASPPYNNTITIREIMAALIDPHADALWNSVRVVVESGGITEYYPETDEEWLSLRLSAVSLIEGSNALMMPGREVAPPGAEGEFPEYEFTPEEVAEKLAADRQSWDGFASQLQSAGFEMLDAIDNRDPDMLAELGAYLDEACEACHSVYWYRAGI